MKTTKTTQLLTTLGGAALLASALPASAQSLINRWTFNEASGTTAHNSVSGGADATLTGAATLNGSGKAVLDGSSGTYVNLGGGLLNGLSSATFTGWFSYTVPNNNVHLFSFDDGSGTGSGGTYLRYNISDTGNGHGGTNFVESIQGWSGNTLHGDQVLPQNQEVFVAVTYDPVNSLEAIYFNGQLASTYFGSLVPLSAFASSGGTLGRSPWVTYGDPNLIGSIDQFSIYDGALSDSQVLAEYQTGPTTVPEPSVFALSGIALLALLRRRNTR